MGSFVISIENGAISGLKSNGPTLHASLSNGLRSVSRVDRDAVDAIEQGAPVIRISGRTRRRPPRGTPIHHSDRRANCATFAAVAQQPQYDRRASRRRTLRGFAVLRRQAQI